MILEVLLFPGVRYGGRRDGRVCGYGNGGDKDEKGNNDGDEEEDKDGDEGEDNNNNDN